MLKSGPQSKGKEEVQESAAQYTPLRRIYDRNQLLRLRNQTASLTIIANIEAAGVLAKPKAKL
jgi:hypothetical protein